MGNERGSISIVALKSKGKGKEEMRLDALDTDKVENHYQSRWLPNFDLYGHVATQHSLTFSQVDFAIGHAKSTTKCFERYRICDCVR